MNNVKRNIIGVWCAWCALGFTRGVQSYNYFFPKWNTNKVPLYSDKIVWGFWGALYYANPFFAPFNLYKEMYRLEVNIRGLEDEKNTDYYKSVSIN